MQCSVILDWQVVLTRSTVALLLLVGIGVNQARAEEKVSAAAVVGIHHMERGYRVDDFYLNSGNFANVGPEGGGGGHACCIVLPSIWHPRLSADIRWSVADWRNAILQEIEKGNLTSVSSEGIYQAQVKIEKYSEPPTRLYVHFYSGGRVRLVTDTAVDPIVERPGEKEGSMAGKLTTQGKPRDDYFTASERKAMQEERRRQRKELGDWR